ncbi:hypothetical protein KFK09_027520 [Dendrobium nobile]|uniref:Uncharacterized protein n=1 Tax=Dendrobium nobile TaxID=94219 RepID=A0A8T3AB22_DENNO|nr:hypothetical protein KFK09_027520 [Dendrobium nobile]
MGVHLRTSTSVHDKAQPPPPSPPSSSPSLAERASNEGALYFLGMVELVPEF